MLGMRFLAKLKLREVTLIRKELSIQLFIELFSFHAGFLK